MSGEPGAAVATAERPRARRARTGAVRHFVQKLPLHLTTWIVIAIWLIPTIGLFVNSVRPIADMSNNGWWSALFPPFNLTLESYQTVWDTPGIPDSIINSILITVPATVFQIAIGAMAGYGFAWMNFRGKEVCFLLIVGLMVVPIQMTLIPVLRMFQATGLAGTFLAIWLAHTGYGLPFQVYLFRNAMGELPKEVFESAQLDGADHVQRFWNLAVPMTIPAIASLTIFVFVGVWNDLLVALTYLGTSPNRPLTVAMTQLTTSLGGGWQFLTAAAVVQMAAPLLVFLLLQRYFTRGITSGSVKG